MKLRKPTLTLTTTFSPVLENVHGNVERVLSQVVIMSLVELRGPYQEAREMTTARQRFQEEGGRVVLSANTWACFPELRFLLKKVTITASLGKIVGR